MGHIGHMGRSPMGQGDIRDKGTRWQSFVHVVHQRTLAEHGYVPVRRSVQDCATRGKLHAVFHMLRVSGKVEADGIA